MIYLDTSLVVALLTPEDRSDRGSGVLNAALLPVGEKRCEKVDASAWLHPSFMASV
jgi:hypothetical protein